MNRIEKKFKELKKENKKAFIAFITCGDPDLATTQKLIRQLEINGADIIELGVPFSDPLADGPIIQAASERALKNKISLKAVLNFLKKLRKVTQIPLILFTYYNPVFKFQESRLVSAAKSAGVDGLIIPDLPPEEAKNLIHLTKKSGLDLIFFLSPTSSLPRIKLISRASRGFIYYVALTGVTGPREEISADLIKNIRLIKRINPAKPVCAGFGVSNLSQVRKISKIADGVVVGSSIIRVIQGNLGKKDIDLKVGRFVKNLTRAL